MGQCQFSRGTAYAVINWERWICGKCSLERDRLQVLQKEHGRLEYISLRIFGGGGEKEGLSTYLGSFPQVLENLCLLPKRCCILVRSLTKGQYSENNPQDLREISYDPNYFTLEFIQANSWQPLCRSQLPPGCILGKSNIM